MDNKLVFAKNLKRYMDLKNKSRKDISEALGISYYTVTDWVNGKKYPRMDKVELLADYFGILKSDLIEDKSEKHIQMQKNNDIIADIVVKLRTDEKFFNAVYELYKLGSKDISGMFEEKEHPIVLFDLTHEKEMNPMFMNSKVLEVSNAASKLDDDQLDSVLSMLNAFVK